MRTLVLSSSVVVKKVEVIRFCGGRTKWLHTHTSKLARTAMSREVSYSPQTESRKSYAALWRDRPAMTVTSCELRGFTKELRLRKAKAILRDLLRTEQANVSHWPNFLRGPGEQILNQGLRASQLSECVRSRYKQHP